MGVHTCSGRECVAIGKELSGLTDWCFQSPAPWAFLRAPNPTHFGISRVLGFGIGRWWLQSRCGGISLEFLQGLCLVSTIARL